MKKFVLGLVACTAFFTVSLPASAERMSPAGTVSFTLNGQNGVTATGWLNLNLLTDDDWASDTESGRYAYFVSSGGIDVSATPEFLAENPNFVTGHGTGVGCPGRVAGMWGGDICNVLLTGEYISSVITRQGTGQTSVWGTEEPLQFSFDSNDPGLRWVELDFGGEAGEINDVIGLGSYNGDHWLISGGSDSGAFTITPEPSSWILLGSGAMALAFMAWRRFPNIASH
jgi:hypothetical protein